MAHMSQEEINVDLFNEVTRLKEIIRSMEKEMKQHCEEKNDLKKQLHQATELVPIDSWHEDMGDCLWWALPIEEPPHCGSPLEIDFPDYVTHFTRLVEPIKR